MADTNQSTENKEQEGGSSTEKEQNFSEVEVKAMEEGWVPKEQWEGDPSQWRDAQTFVDRGELFKKIEDQNRTIKDFKKALQDLQMHHSKVRETEYKRAIDALKVQKEQALEDGDAKSVIKIEDQIDLIKDEQVKLRQIESQPQVQDVNPEFTAWVDRNKWYNTDEDARTYADGLGRSLAAAGLSPSEVLKQVESRVKQAFPHKFRNPNRDRAAAVEGSSAKGGKSEDSTQLSEDERRVMQRFIRTIPGFDEKQYITELKRVKGGA